MVGLLKYAKVAVMVSDMDRAIAFYTKKLGFALKARYDDWAEVKGPGILFGFYPGKSSGKRSDAVSIGFEVADLDKAVKELGKKGIKFELFDEDYMRFAYFADPDGTELYLAQKKR